MRKQKSAKTTTSSKTAFELCPDSLDSINIGDDNIAVQSDFNFDKESSFKNDVPQISTTVSPVPTSDNESKANAFSAQTSFGPITEHDTRHPIEINMQNETFVNVSVHLLHISFLMSHSLFLKTKYRSFLATYFYNFYFSYFIIFIIFYYCLVFNF